MTVDEFAYAPIGIIRTPFRNVEGVPIQSSGAIGIKGKIELKREFVSGLKDLDGFSHIILIYHFHRSKGYSLEVVPFLDDKPRGLFSTRAPKRPNPIGISVVKLLRIDAHILEIENVDMVDGTPLLDIKPYVSEFDWVEGEKKGWLSGAIHKAKEKRSDSRFKIRSPQGDKLI
jgi:tRNA-Thr(GGU) m(6)t(6)A37 methyltransferase TsaA